MIPNEIVVNPQALTAIVLLTNVVVQVIKRLSIVQNNRDLLPLFALVLGGVIGYGTTFVYPDVAVGQSIIQGIVSSMTAAGLYDAFTGTKNKITGTGDGK